MAARISPAHDAATRAKIKASALILRLQAYALGEVDPQSGRPVEMTRGQTAAALGLLKKVIPDRMATTVAGDEEAPLEVVYRWAGQPKEAGTPAPTTEATEQ